MVKVNVTIPLTIFSHVRMDAVSSSPLSSTLVSVVIVCIIKRCRPNTGLDQESHWQHKWQCHYNNQMQGIKKKKR